MTVIDYSHASHLISLTLVAKELKVLLGSRGTRRSSRSFLCFQSPARLSIKHHQRVGPVRSETESLHERSGDPDQAQNAATPMATVTQQGPTPAVLFKSYF